MVDRIPQIELREDVPQAPILFRPELRVPRYLGQVLQAQRFEEIGFTGQESCDDSVEIGRDTPDDAAQFGSAASSTTARGIQRTNRYCPDPIGCLACSEPRQEAGGTPFQICSGMMGIWKVAS